MTSFAHRIRPAVQAELDAAAAAEAQGRFWTAFHHFERAHVLGQSATVEHVRVHWRMFRFAVRNRMAVEAFGQAWRVVAAAIFTPLGVVPRGNTGGSDVNGLRSLQIPADLQAVIDEAHGAPQPRGAVTAPAAVALTAVALVVTVGLTGCGSPPKDLDVSLDKPSSAGTYRVALLPPATAPAINQMHSWKVRLATADGAPVRGAKFAVDGGMPQHGHGLPTQPRVTREVAEGTYQLDGMKFSMTGWWEVKLAIDAAQGPDKVTFNTVVQQPAARP